MSAPKWHDKPKKDNKKHEQTWAKARGGKAQPSSGRFWHAKLDVKDEELLTDNKQTERLSYSIRVADWRMLQRAAAREGLSPCLQITFLQESGPAIHLAVISAELITRNTMENLAHP
jgi:hypothetical protein